MGNPFVLAMAMRIKGVQRATVFISVSKIKIILQVAQRELNQPQIKRAQHTHTYTYRAARVKEDEKK